MIKEANILNRYKNYFFPLGSVFAGIVLIFAVIFPQIGSVSEELSAIRQQREEVDALSESYDNLVSQPSDELDAVFTTAITSLPSEKQLALIFSALSAAAAQSGTSIREFSLTVGGVFGRAAALSSGVSSTPGVEVIVRLAGSDTSSFANFARSLQEQIPLSEVNKINLAGDTATYEVKFFYKPIDSAKIQNQHNIPPLSKQDKELVKTLASWGEDN